MKGVLSILCVLALSGLAHGELYKWVDEKGTVHFTDDLTQVPTAHRPGTEIQKTPREAPVSTERKPPSSVPSLKAPEPTGMEVPLFRKHELLLTEVTLNGRVRRYFIVDTGASFTLINRQTAKELGITVDGQTPVLPIFTASDVILTPMVNLRAVRAGEAEAENVDVLIHDLPSGTSGLLGNSFLNRYKVVLDSVHGKMTLYPLKGEASPDRPGGYSRDFWTGQFRFYHRTLEELKRLNAKYQKQGDRSEQTRIHNTIRYFENQLDELEQKASLAGVPRHWRE